MLNKHNYKPISMAILLTLIMTIIFIIKHHHEHHTPLTPPHQADLLVEDYPYLIK